jgi:aldose 1-epimerase
MATPITKVPFGKTPDGTVVDLYTLTNSHGLVCKVITYGAIITELLVPDRIGKMGDIVLGLDSVDAYVRGNSPYLGAVIGRVTNRIGRGRFTLDGKTYQLPVNNGKNTLHGGLKGFDKVVWSAEADDSADGPSVVFTHVSPDGAEGFPGNLTVRMRYTLTNGDELRFDYEATTDKPTAVNLTNHSYFNLACSGTIHSHVLQVKASKHTATTDDQIPTGVLESVLGGPLDFTSPKPLGKDLDAAPGGQRGYDHNYVIDGGGQNLVLAARLHEPNSGRTIEVSTDQPAVQVYTGNNLDGSVVGKRGLPLVMHGAVCLETQHFPDSVNHPHFPSTILRPGETFRSTTIYRFATK